MIIQTDIRKCIFPTVGLASESLCPTECFEGEELSTCYTAQDIWCSTQGYYIKDELDIVEALFSVKKCNEGIFKMFIDCKINAVNDLIRDLRSEILNQWDHKFSKTKQKLGEQKNLGAQSTKEWSTLIISPDEIKGGGLYIDQMFFGSTVSRQNIPIFIYKSNDMETPIWANTSGLTSEAGKWTKNNLCDPIYLDFSFEEDCDEKNSYVIMWNSNNNPVLKSKIDCGCSGKTKFKQHFTVQGATFNTGDKLNCSNNAFGLSLNTRFCCDPLLWLCDCEVVEGYEMKNVLAKAFQFKILSKLISKILDSNQIDAFTMLNRENLYGKRNHFEKRYGEYVEWITMNLQEQKITDCLKCKKSKRQILKSSILI